MNPDRHPSPALRRICVYCGSLGGRSPRYAEAASELGRTLADAGIGVVFGGGRIGLMGIVADAALAAGGSVTGVIPRHLQRREVAHGGLSELILVDTMHQRKARMVELSDAFIALPGGAGTLDELFETWTWAQLGLHGKPIGILNVDGFYDPLLAHVARMDEAGFLRSGHREMLSVADDVPGLLFALGHQAKTDGPGRTDLDRA